MGNERICKAVGYLERNTEKHRKDKECGHSSVFEQAESLGAECLCNTLGFGLSVHRAGWESKTVQEYYETCYSRNIKLIVRMLELDTVYILHKVNEEHAAYETDRPEDPDRWKILHGIEAVFH